MVLEARRMESLSGIKSQCFSQNALKAPVLMLYNKIIRVTKCANSAKTHF